MFHYPTITSFPEPEELPPEGDLASELANLKNQLNEIKKNLK